MERNIFSVFYSSLKPGNCNKSSLKSDILGCQILPTGPINGCKLDTREHKSKQIDSAMSEYKVTLPAAAAPAAVAAAPLRRHRFSYE